MKNIEKYLNEFLESDDLDCINCTCCKLRLGYELNCDELTSAECEHHKKLNKQWLKAEYVSKEAIYVLRGLAPQITHIRQINNGEIVVSNDYIPHPDEDYISTSFNKRLWGELSNIFRQDLFDFLPSGKDVLISDILELYKDIY